MRVRPVTSSPSRNRALATDLRAPGVGHPCLLSTDAQKTEIGKCGAITELPVIDNQFVHKGDLLMLVDPTNYTIGVQIAEAAAQQAMSVADYAQAESERRQKLGDWASQEERQSYLSRAV